MKILINSAFFDNNKCVENVANIKALKTPEKLIYKVEDKQNIIYLKKDNYKLRRLINDSEFILDLLKKKAYVKLNEQQQFEIPVVKLNYEFSAKIIMIEYQLDTEENLKKLLITME